MSRRHRDYGHARRRSLAPRFADEAMAAAGEHRPTSVATPAWPVATGHDPVATTSMATPAVATVTMASSPVSSGVARVRGLATRPPRWWVLDPGDNLACVRELLELHDLEDGRVVCHPRPGATWPVLVEDLLRALGKHPQALTRERRTQDGDRLLDVWLRAEQIRHLVVLRTNWLRPEVLGELHALADAQCTLWLVWHRRDPPPTPHPRIAWTATAAVLRASAEAPSAACRGAYAAAFEAARVEARGWRPDGHRLGWQVPYWEHAWPGCDLGSLLQRLTIDAADPAELRTRLYAAQHGFAAEGRRLMLPELQDGDLAELGPRLPPAVIARLRELVCPATAAGVMLGLATDAEAPFLAGQPATGWSSSLERVHLLAGNYRVPSAPAPCCGPRSSTTTTPHRGKPCSPPPGAPGPAPNASRTSCAAAPT